MAEQYKKNYKKVIGKSSITAASDRDLTNKLDAAALAFPSVSGSFIGNGFATVVASGSSLVVNGLSSSLLLSSGNNLIEAGKNNSAISVINSVILGPNNTIDSYAYSSYPYNVQANFIAGSGNTITNASWTAEGNFVQGRGNNLQYGYICFVQGVNNLIEPNSDRSFCVGKSNSLLGTSSKTFVQGDSISASGAANSLTQGRNHIIVGSVNKCTGSTNKINGEANSIHGTSNEVVGDYCLIVGENNKIVGDRSMALGFDCAISADDCFAQGNTASAIRDGQRAWGAFHGQYSAITDNTQTYAALEVSLITLNLIERHSYGIKILISANNMEAAGETATFELSNALAYRDTGGPAILVNDPIAISGINSGGGSTTWEAKLMASGNDILLRVIGDAADQVRWAGNLEFAETLGV